jgi:hypothetical protein
MKLLLSIVALFVLSSTANGQTVEFFEWLRRHDANLKAQKAAQVQRSLENRSERLLNTWRRHVRLNSELRDESDKYFGEPRVWAAGDHKVEGRLTGLDKGRATFLFDNDVVHAQLSDLNRPDQAHLQDFDEWQQKSNAKKKQWVIERRAFESSMQEALEKAVQDATAAFSAKTHEGGICTLEVLQMNLTYAYLESAYNDCKPQKTSLKEFSSRAHQEPHHVTKCETGEVAVWIATKPNGEVFAVSVYFKNGVATHVIRT